MCAIIRGSSEDASVARNGLLLLFCMPPRSRVTSGPMLLQQSRSMLTSMTYVATKAVGMPGVWAATGVHCGAHGLCHHRGHVGLSELCYHPGKMMTSGLGCSRGATSGFHFPVAARVSVDVQDVSDVLVRHLSPC